MSTTVPYSFVGPLAPGENRAQPTVLPQSFVGPLTPNEVYGNVPSSSFASISGAGSGTAAGTVAAPHTYRNVGLDQYDLATPDGRVNYFNAVQGQLTGQQDQLKDKYSQSLGSYDLQDANLATQRSNYFRDLAKQGNDFNQSYDLGNVQRAQNFSGMGPNAFQSSQATSADYADKQHLRGLGDLQVAGDQAGTGFDQQAQALTQGRQNLDTGYRNDLNSVATQLGGLQSNLENYDSYYKQPTGNYAAASDISYQAPKVDLAGYNPAISGVGSLAGTPGAQGAGKFSFAPTSGLNPQDSYFGYSPNQGQKDYLQNYFKTGSIA